MNTRETMAFPGPPSLALLDHSEFALYAIDLELTPFYCPACRACFCGDHWQSGSIWDDGFHDSSRGACPNGHERMLED